MVRNREHVTGVVGASVLDEIVSPDEQLAWLADPIGMNAADGPQLISVDPSQSAAHQHEFDRLAALPEAMEVITALGEYASACIPFPRRTEATFWTVSCLPDHQRHVYFRVSMVMLETIYFEVGDDPSRIAATMFVDNRHLSLNLLGRNKLRRRGATLRERKHSSAGAFEQAIQIPDLSNFPSVLSLPTIQSAAAHHNLNLMRRRQSGYKNSHCPQLAEAALTLQ
ncbi:hypothetical protein GCM10027167_23960 [Nocardia heshunensis]